MTLVANRLRVRTADFTKIEVFMFKPLY